MILNDPEVLNWIQSCNEWDMPFQEAKAREGNQKNPVIRRHSWKILLSTWFLAGHPAEEEFVCVTGEAIISLNETPVCGSKVQGLSPYSQWQDLKKVSSE